MPKPASSVQPSPTVKPVPTGIPISFSGKTITIVVPYTAGGGTDIMARVYARYLPKFLPGNPTILVRNMPGGGATIGANYVYSSKPDGLASLASAGGVHMAYVTRMSAAKYDFQKMHPVMAVQGAAVYYIKPGIVDKVEDLPKAKGVIFGQSSGSISWIFAAFVELMGIRPEKMVLGYGGSGDSRRAFVSGEINTSGSTTQEYWQIIDGDVKKGAVQNLFQTGAIDEKGEVVKDSSLPTNLPTGKEVYEKVSGKSPSGMAWEAYKGILSAGRSFDVVLSLPPGTPDAITRVWWDAASKMVKDPEFANASDPLLGAKGKWFVGESFSKAFKSAIMMDAKVVDWFKGVMLQYGIVIE
ncbi:MAG: hypothetical protein HYX90_05715 [Chloroflexi bacterium]|nr:hypothetical protein [Chloroflexota bacterium]